MTLRYSYELEGLSIITWEQITATHIRQSIIGMNLNPPLEDLTVSTNIISQNPIIGLDEPAPASGSSGAPLPTSTPTLAPTSPGVRGRALQQEEQKVPLRIAFDTGIAYRSAGTDYNTQELIANAFNTDQDRQQYINMLRRADPEAFQDLTEIVSVSVGGRFIPAIKTEEEDDGRDMTLLIIIGSVAGGAALILLILLFVWRRSTNQGESVGGGKTQTMSHGNSGENGNGVTA